MSDEAKIPLFLGLGSEYAPKLDPLRRCKRMLIVENISDFRLLTIWGERLGAPLPQNIVAWPWTAGAKERKQLFLQLREEIPDLRVLSICDRDDTALEQVDKQNLRDKSNNPPSDELKLRVWRRRHIENYVLWPPAIARAAAAPQADIEAHLGPVDISWHPELHRRQG